MTPLPCGRRHVARASKRRDRYSIRQPLHRSSTPQIISNISPHGTQAIRIHVEYDAKRGKPKLGRKFNLAERSCSTPSAQYAPQDWSKAPYSTTGPLLVRLGSTVYLCLIPSHHHVAFQHQAKPGVLEISLSSVLHVSDEFRNCGLGVDRPVGVPCCTSFPDVEVNRI
jgi:hypothetical protein